MSDDEKPVIQPAPTPPVATPRAKKPKPTRSRRADAPADGITLTPGTHLTPTEVIEVSGAEFADAVIARLRSFDAIYRRGPLAGTIEDGEFRPLLEGPARIYLDRYGPRPQHWRPIEGEAQRVYEPYSTNLAELVLAAVSAHPDVPDVELVVRGPVYRLTGQGLLRVEPGYDRNARIYSIWGGMSDEPGALTLDPLDLIEDFPFQTNADKAAFVACILTILLRPAIKGNVPMFLFGASGPGSGKTMLVETVIGCLLLGKRVGALQIGSEEAERDKRFSSVLMRGDQVVLLDNLPHRLDSASLAAAITSEFYLARWLGTNRLFETANRAVWCLTANNLGMTEELARRTIPIRLEPLVEDRTFRFPDLALEIERNRDAYLRGIEVWLARWEAAGRPRSATTIPSFEAWSRIIGGIMEANGWADAWLANRRSFMDGSDTDLGDLRKLMDHWHEHMPRMSTRDLKALCEAHGCFPAALDKSSERGALIALGRALQRYRGRVCGGYKLLVEGTGSERWYVRKKVT